MDRLKAYSVIGLCYVIACVAAWLLFVWFIGASTGIYTIILGLFLADVVATVIIWLFGIIFKNSSFYDPYWSLIPWLIVLGVMIKFSYYNINNILFLIVLGIWSFRLTFNWAYTCKNIKTEDWRYQNYRKNNGPLMWHIINFFGINMVPTLVVFLGLIPGIILLNGSPSQFSPLVLIGLAIILLGTALELFADIAMHSFKKNNKDSLAVLNTGLWKYSRHPNYLGEILIWVGVYTAAALIVQNAWMWIFGVIAMILLFEFISIPLAEKRHLARRPGYKEYIETTSRLLILPPKNKIADAAKASAQSE